MEKIDFVKEFLSQTQITPLEVCKLFINNGMVDINDLTEKTPSISITRDNLSLIKPGMYWYEDNTVSADLIPDKTVKSVVLLVNNYVVYGDTFDSFYGTWHQAQEYIKNYTNTYIAKGEAYWLGVRALEAVSDKQKAINQALEVLGENKWNNRHWSSTEYDEWHAWFVYLYSASRGYSGKYDTTYIRPVLVHKI